MKRKSLHYRIYEEKNGKDLIRKSCDYEEKGEKVVIEGKYIQIIADHQKFDALFNTSSSGSTEKDKRNKYLNRIVLILCLLIIFTIPKS